MAESQVAHIEPAILGVLTESQDESDPDLDQYVAIYNHLANSAQRCALVQDYAAWECSRDLINQARAAVMAITQYEPGPAIERLARLGIPSPKKWFICPKCDGKGEGSIGYCIRCSGKGYMI